MEGTKAAALEMFITSFTVGYLAGGILSFVAPPSFYLIGIQNTRLMFEVTFRLIRDGLVINAVNKGIDVASTVFQEV